MLVTCLVRYHNACERSVLNKKARHLRCPIPARPFRSPLSNQFVKLGDACERPKWSGEVFGECLKKQGRVEYCEVAFGLYWNLHELA